MMNFLKKKRILVPAAILMMLVAAYAQKLSSEKETLVGTLQSPILDEISGIAASSVYPDMLYVHNDSGDSSRFFAITPKGDLKATYHFTGEKGISLGVRDCEDIAVGPGPQSGKSYVYLGDIGDNKADHPYVTVYRFDEQATKPDAANKNISGDRVYLKYPDGPRDAETLMIDPIEKLIYIVSKRSGSVNIYTTPLDFKTTDTLTLTKRASIHFGGLPPFKWITAGDISKDGSQILLRNYEHVYYWQRIPGEPAWQTMTRKPRKMYYKKEKQGEAVGFASDGKGYFTTSEGQGEPIYYYRLTQ